MVRGWTGGMNSPYKSLLSVPTPTLTPNSPPSGASAWKESVNHNADSRHTSVKRTRGWNAKAMRKSCGMAFKHLINL